MRSRSAGLAPAPDTVGLGDAAHIDKSGGCSPNANHLHSRSTAMAVQIINDMPDVEVHRGEPFAVSLHELNAPRAETTRFSGRAICLGITIAIHVIGALAFMQMTYQKHSEELPAPILATVIDEAPPVETPPPQYAPPPMDVV